MKNLIVYSSNTGNTKKLATEIYNNVPNQDEWVIEDVKNKPDVSGYDVVLLGGWAESGNLDKASLKFFSEMDKTNKKIGLFITMGSRTSTEHGKFCEKNLSDLLNGLDSLGIQLVQGKISEGLMSKLENMPDSVIPESVKVAMKDGFENYSELSSDDYKKIADHFLNNLA